MLVSLRRSVCVLPRCPRALPTVRSHYNRRSYSQSGEGGRGLGSYEKENILTVPNVLTLSRILLSPLTGYLVVEGHYTMALGLFSVLGVTDILDGYIARRFKGQSSNLGSVLDPLADKVFMSIFSLSMTYAGLLPVPLVVVILGRDGLLLGASFYLRYTTLPPPRTWKRYWNIQRSTVQITPNILGKVTSGLQLLSVGAPLLATVTDITSTLALHVLWVVTGVATVGSGGSYLYKMKGFKLLNKS